MWEWLLLIGAVSTIANFVMNIIGTALAIKRTRMQEEARKWKIRRMENERR
jgi:hypothetical protein